jgi:hypothetical protein
LKRKAIDAKTLYEQVYCARGEMENRIKEQQLDLFAERTSTATMAANQLRLWFSSFAYARLWPSSGMAERVCEPVEEGAGGFPGVRWFLGMSQNPRAARDGGAPRRSHR